MAKNVWLTSSVGDTTLQVYIYCWARHVELVTLDTVISVASAFIPLKLLQRLSTKLWSILCPNLVYNLSWVETFLIHKFPATNPCEILYRKPWSSCKTLHWLATSNSLMDLKTGYNSQGSESPTPCILHILGFILLKLTVYVVFLDGYTKYGI